MFLGVAGLGCGDDFAPYNRLNTLRVLAIRGTPAAPAPGQALSLDALVYHLEGDPSPDYEWSWCPFPGSAGEGYPCLVTEEEVAMIAGQAGITVPSFNLGTQKTATLPHNIDPAIFQAICMGTPGVPVLPDCEGGFPIQIKLRVNTPTDEVIAVRTVRLRFLDTHEPNQNPRIDGLVAELEGVEQPITDVPALSLPRDVDTVIRARVTPDQSEAYMGKDTDGEVGPTTERLNLSWFVESGNTDEDRTGFIAEIVPLEEALENKWKPSTSADYPRPTSKLIVVIRDSRGGVSWAEGVVNLEATP